MHDHYAGAMPVLRLFASAREAAGVQQARFDGTTVHDVLTEAVDTFGAGFEQVLATCKVWVNGEPAESTDPLGENDEVAVLPPVSGGCR